MSPDSRNGRPVGGDRTTYRIPNQQDNPPGYRSVPTRDMLGDWWTSPATCYWLGLQDGVQMAREYFEAMDDQVHREAVQEVIRFIAVADHRVAHDQGEAGE